MAGDLGIVAHVFKRGNGGFCTRCGTGQGGNWHIDTTVDTTSDEPVVSEERPPEVAMVNVAQLQFHPRNIRRDLGDLRDLTRSIQIEGLLQPILVHRVPGGLQLVDGHRRVAAARIGKVKRVPAVIVATLNEDEVITKALTTGVLKQDISKDERRVAVRALMHEFKHTAAAIAEKVGVSEATVYSWSKAPSPTGGVKRRPAPSLIGVGRLRAVLDDWRDGASEEVAALIKDIEQLMPPRPEAVAP